MKYSKLRVVALVIIFISFIFMVRALILRDSIEWDESVNIGMGKYIFSEGKIGLWEDQRPVILPLIFGFTWWLGLDAFLLGKIFMFLFALCGLILIYLIGKKVFNEETGLVALIFLSTSTIFIHHSNNLMSNLPSAVLGLASLYFLVEKKYFFSGIFVALAFLTRFTLGIIFLAIIIILLYKLVSEKKNINRSLLFFLGFIVLVFPYMIINGFFYQELSGNFLTASVHPMVWASSAAAEGSPYLFINSRLFYLKGIFFEFLVALFLLPAAYFFFKKKLFRRIPETSIFLSMFLLLVYYLFAVQNTLRYIIDFLPLLALVSAYGFISFLISIKKKSTKIMIVILVIWMIIFSIMFSSFQERVKSPYVGRNFDFYKEASFSVGIVLASDPSIAYFQDVKIVPAFTVDRFIYSLDKQDYDLVIFIPYFLVCHDVYFSPKNVAYEELIKGCDNKKLNISKFLDENYILKNQTKIEYFFVKKR